MTVNDRLQQVRRAARAEAIARFRRQPIRDNHVFYEAYSGRGMLCNPAAIFRHLRHLEEFSDLHHIWVIEDDADRARLDHAFRNDRDVEFVGHETTEYWKGLSRSRYLINNATFPPSFGKRDGQTYLNTWHGIPLKAMGYDVPDGGPAAVNVLRNFVAADYLLASSRSMVDGMYRNAYRLQGIYRGAVIEEGCPRIDDQFGGDDMRAATRRELVRAGISIDDRRVVLYAPTWSGSSFYRASADVEALRAVVRHLADHLDPATTAVLLKVHQVVYDEASRDQELRPWLVPNHIPTNQVLGITDTLITNYSSIFYDFLATGKHVVFFLPDVERYSAERGLYQDPAELPGPTVTDLAKLAPAVLSDRDDPTFAERRAATVQRFVPHDDGHATERIVDVVFRGHEEGHRIHTDFRDDRESILIYLGGMHRNGITSSALNLLRNIDHDRFDVTAFYAKRTSKQFRQIEHEIDDRVRLLPRLGGINGSKIVSLARRRLLEATPGTKVPMRRQLDANFHDEWVRCFGQSAFDHVIDFSGYSGFWDHILLAGSAPNTAIWLHNDMAADQQRIVNGRQPHRYTVQSAMNEYRRFDHLVSVSESLAAVNRENLAQYANAKKFVSARNSIDADYIRQRAFGDYSDSFEPSAATVPSSISTVIAELLEHYSPTEIRHELYRQRIARDLGQGGTTFITIGRLSPEKNHRRLLEAFAAVHRERPDTALVIVGGGPLRAELDALCNQLGVSEAVTFTGQLDNPFVHLSLADCFVLSSDYEGQPMVILEALVLGLPVVITRFSSADHALDPDQGLIVPRTTDGLAEGMRQFLRGEVPSTTFDADSYNTTVIGEVYAALGID